MTFDLCFAVYNSQKWLENCLRAIAESDYPQGQIGLYFADNASSDDSLAILTRLKAQYGDGFRAFEILPQGENKGFGTASNSAARQGDGEYVFFCNVDTEIHRDAFTELEKAIQGADPVFAAFELRQFPYEHPKYYNPVTMETSWASGACFVLRRELFEKTGGFDETIFMYAEDVDLSWHIRSLGYKIQYVPRAVITHYAYSEAGEVKPTQVAGSMAGNTLLRYKYGNGAVQREGNKLREKALFQFSGDANSDLLPAIQSQMARVNRFKSQYKDFYRRQVQPSGFRARFLDFDYEFARAGAFYENHLPETAPEITVVIRTYQRPEMLALTLQSLGHQTYKNFKVVVVEDGVQPVAGQVVEEAGQWLDIQYLPAKTACGRCKAGNRGIEAADTDYVCFLDDDDYFFAEHLEVMACLIEENPDCEIFFTGAVEAAFDSKKDVAHALDFEKFQNISHENLSVIDFFSSNPVPIQAVVFKKDLYNQYGGLDETLDALEDWDLWMRYITKARFASADKATSLYRVPAALADHLQRDKFISKYRGQVFEKMKNYTALVSAQDVYALIWTPKEIVLSEDGAGDVIDDDQLVDTVEEICHSTSWKITVPLRIIPSLFRTLFGGLQLVVNKIMQGFVFVFTLVGKGFYLAYRGVRALSEKVGPRKPDTATATEEEMVSFVMLWRRSLSLRFAQWLQRLRGGE